MSHVTCHLSLMITATATNPPLLTLPLSTVGWFTVGCLQKTEKVEKPKIHQNKKKQQLNLCHRRPKLAIRSSTRTFFDLRNWVYCNGTHRQTDRHATLWPTRPRGPSWWKYMNEFFAQKANNYVSTQILLFVHASYVVRPCKFRCVSMKISGKDQKNCFLMSNPILKKYLCSWHLAEYILNLIQPMLV